MTETPVNLQPRPIERFRALMASRLGGAILLLMVFAIILVATLVKDVPTQQLVSLTVRGLMLGGIIALGAIGLTLISGVLKMANFAHGDFMSLGAYMALLAIALLPTGQPMGPFSFGPEFLAALLFAMLAVGFVAWLFDRYIYRRLRARRTMSVVIAMASLGVALLVRSIIYISWGGDFSFYYAGRARPATAELFMGIRVRPDQLFILGLAVVFIILIWFVLERTRLGKAMRATADNPDLARISGINTDRVVMWTWFIGGALAGASGVMYGLDAQLRPEMGWFLLLPLFASVILGTLGNPYGALVGALVIGVAWQVSSAFLNPAYGPAVAFVVMIIVLLFRPQGLFGKAGS